YFCRAGGNRPDGLNEPVTSDYQAAIDILRKRAASELDGGFRAHHNALIYAANELENAQAFGREVGHES
ncbi:hypothetical protein CG697_25440, partial [Escherichia coli]